MFIHSVCLLLFDICVISPIEDNLPMVSILLVKVHMFIVSIQLVDVCSLCPILLADAHLSCTFLLADMYFRCVHSVGRCASCIILQAAAPRSLICVQFLILHAELSIVVSVCIILVAMHELCSFCKQICVHTL